MNIFIYDEQDSLQVDHKELKKIVMHLLDFLKIACDEISIHLVDKKKISQLHKKYFNDPTPTDCISFPMDLEQDTTKYHILGEVFVCTDVAIEYAKNHRKKPLEELLLYLIHGVLHLIGYDDIEEKDRIEMRKKEKSCMEYIKNLSM